MLISSNPGIEKIAQIIFAIIFIVMIFLLGKSCETITRPQSYDSNGLKYFKDSTHYFEQKIIFEDSRNLIRQLQDSLHLLMSKNSGVTSTGLVSYKEDIDMGAIKARYINSVDTMVHRIISQQIVLDSIKFGKATSSSNSTSSTDAVVVDKITVPAKFQFDNKWIKGFGTVYKDRVDLDTIHIISEPTIVFGSNKRGDITALIGNKNPYATQSEANVYMYKPKKHRFSLVLGPSYSVTNSGLKLGLGATLGYKIF